MKYLKMYLERPPSACGIAWLCRLSIALKPVLICYALHCFVVFGIVLYVDESMKILPGGFINPHLIANTPVVEKFIRWDAHWYTYIAQQGYDIQSIVFFPVTMLFIRYLAPLVEYNYGLAGFVICNIFSFASFIILYYVFRLDYSEDTAYRALIAYSVFPTSFYLNSIYTEPVFLTFALACIYFCRKGIWLWAGLFAVLAALTRNIGIFLTVFMVFELWKHRLSDSRHLKSAAVSIAAAPLALCSFMVFNYWLTGDFLAFMHSQKSWGREFTLPWVNIWNSATQIYLTLPSPEPGLVLDFMLVAFSLGALASLTLSKDLRMPRSYLAVGWAWLIVPLFSAAAWLPLYSMSRFALVLFPLYLFIAQLPKTIYRIAVTLSAGGLAWYTVLFSSWHWVS